MIYKYIYQMTYYDKSYNFGVFTIPANNGKKAYKLFRFYTKLNRNRIKVVSITKNSKDLKQIPFTYFFNIKEILE